MILLNGAVVATIVCECFFYFQPECLGLLLTKWSTVLLLRIATDKVVHCFIA